MSNNKKTGLFLCRCGSNIADFVDLEKVKEWAEQKDFISFVETHDLLCSPDGKKFVEDTIRQKNSDNVVIAACSPKMHQKTFEDAAGKAGMNMAMVQMANIREQCAWVTKDKKEATDKSKVLINAAIERSALHDELFKQSIECATDVVVIGGGVAGIEAAIMLAKSGRKVTIIEKEISLGGKVIKTEEIGPSMECAPCVLAPRLSEITDNENIEVVANAEVKEILGFYGNFTVRAVKKKRYVESSCIGCEACFDVCPVSVKNDFHLGMGERKAIYTLFPGSVPDEAIIDEKNCLYLKDKSCDACVEACPFDSIDFTDQDQELEFEAGAIVLATGYDNVNVLGNDKLAYEAIDNVYTMQEFDRIVSSNGPFTGTLQLKNGEKPSSVAIINCAGSLTEEGLPYCSGICCMTALKAANLVRHQVPHAKIYNIHDRVVLNGADQYHFMEKEKKEGTKFIKSLNLSAIKIEKQNGKISVSGEDFDTLIVDMVILSTGMKPASDNEKIAEMLHLDLDSVGFYKADHTVLHTTGTSVDGVYSAGSCSSPCSASDAITRAQACAGDILAKLIPGKKIDLEILTSVIDSELCASCRMCISVCPYNAISYKPEDNASIINEAICRGCGTCAATCPSNAITAKHFTDKQIYAELGGLINE
jgi:heterodisulfide reductase subunit A